MILADIITDPTIFLDTIFLRLKNLNFNVDAYFLDHICYRVGTLAEYESRKRELKDFGTLLVESMVNGRMIATYKLNSPIVYKDRLIDVLELPAPKPGSSYDSGLEHAEFVTSEPLSIIVANNSHLVFETQGIDKKINADITLRLGDLCIRFHNQTLEEVIELEKNL